MVQAAERIKAAAPPLSDEQKLRVYALYVPHVVLQPDPLISDD